MLRVGLTGELGSGKSTVARLLAERGAVVLSSDEMARSMMEPGHAVYLAILEQFGPEVVRSDGRLDRAKLASLAFALAKPRVEELNAIVHPAVLLEQERRLGALAERAPEAIAVVESALIFTTQHGAGGWAQRFDRIILVTAPDALKISRFAERVAGGRLLDPPERVALELDAAQRLARQRIPAAAAAGCLLIENGEDLPRLEQEVDQVWAQLHAG